MDWMGYFALPDDLPPVPQLCGNGDGVIGNYYGQDVCLAVGYRGEQEDRRRE